MPNHDADFASLIRDRARAAAGVLSAVADGETTAIAAVVAEKIVASLRAGGKVVFFGNGGSSMDAGHLAAELLGRFYRERAALAAVSLADNTAAMTAVANDYDYGEVFARQLRGLARRGDVVVALSTSGNSPNVIRALAVGRELGVFSVLLTGATGGQARALADLCVQVPTDDTPRVQEACMHLGHSICEVVERAMFAPPPRDS